MSEKLKALKDELASVEYKLENWEDDDGAARGPGISFEESQRRRTNHYKMRQVYRKKLDLIEEIQRLT